MYLPNGALRVYLYTLTIMRFSNAVTFVRSLLYIDYRKYIRIEQNEEKFTKTIEFTFLKFGYDTI